MDKVVNRENYFKYSLISNLIIVVILLFLLSNFSLTLRTANFLFLVPIVLVAAIMKGVFLVRLGFNKLILGAIIFSCLNLILYFIVLFKV